jgi:hypothetical protein
MKWEDIKTTFKNQWVLIEVQKVDERFNIIEGEVLAHSKDKDEVYQKLLQIRPKEFSIEYTGEVPEDLAIVMANTHESL